MKPKLKKVTNYKEAMALMHSEGDSKAMVKLGHNTHLRVLDGGGYVVTYHNNAIIYYYDDCTIMQDCGWATRTTTIRLNELTRVTFRIRNGKHQYHSDYNGWLPLSKYGLQSTVFGFNSPSNKQQK